MVGNKLSRKVFINKTTSVFFGVATGSGLKINNQKLKPACREKELPLYLFEGDKTSQVFTREMIKVLPEEEPYTYHKLLSETPVHILRRNFKEVPDKEEISLSVNKWKLILSKDSSPLLQNAVNDFADYMDKSMDVRIETEEIESPDGWQRMDHCIVAGTRDQLSGCGTTLKGPKDYEIEVRPDHIIICGYDERGVMFGLYNLEARMNLREAPFLPKNLKTVRHSLYDVRLVMSWMGWMEWPDTLLSHLAHYGFDGIYASPMANPNGDRSTAESSTDFYARILYKIRDQDTSRMKDLIKRAARFGIKVYAPIIYQFMGTLESEAGLRKLVRDILKEFPEIEGYILLTEGFWYREWHGTRGNDSAEREWIENWAGAVGIVLEECHRINPSIEILPWDYNIANQKEKAEMKRYLIRQLPVETIPLLTWENGKSFKIDKYEGKLNDYSISQIGPSEVAHAQIEEARLRNMRVYCNADTFVCGGQFQTVPYQPFPYQWYERYKALENYGINGTLESWTSGFTPNFMSELRTWYCWSDAPDLEELLGKIASRNFGKESKEMVIKAWHYFSEAIRLIPDTGPTMGTSNAIGNPLFFQEPPARTATFKYSWTDQEKWMSYSGGLINPYWPFAVFWLTFVPDFTNQINMAEVYARSVSGTRVSADEKILPVFLNYINQAAELMGKGLKLYREAALRSPDSKRQNAFKEVIIAEQLKRMMESECAILEFEDLRFNLIAEKDNNKAEMILGRMEKILHEEIARTTLAIIAAKRDSRLGFQQECDYVYTPFSLTTKLGILNDILKDQIPAARNLL